MKFNTEKDSIDYFVNRLEDNGWTNVSATQSTNQYSYYDISATYNGVDCRFELKRRNYSSTTFGDSMCETWKYTNFTNDINEGKFQKGFLVSFFDDVLTIDDITAPTEFGEIMANKTTEFENRNIVLKKTVHYKQAVKKNYDYTRPDNTRSLQ